MIARLAGLFALSILTMGAVVGPVLQDMPACELQAAGHLVRAADLRGDWDKLLDARARLERLVQQRDIAGLVHYQLGCLGWRLSSLVYLAEWLEAAWAALRSAFEHGHAWSELLLSGGSAAARDGYASIRS